MVRKHETLQSEANLKQTWAVNLKKPKTWIVPKNDWSKQAGIAKKN